MTENSKKYNRFIANDAPIPTFRQESRHDRAVKPKTFPTPGTPTPFRRPHKLPTINNLLGVKISDTGLRAAVVPAPRA